MKSASCMSAPRWVGDDVVVGDDMRVFADDETAARNRNHLVQFGRLFRGLVVGFGRGIRRRRLRLGIGKIAGRGDAVGVDLVNAIFDRRRDVAGRGEVKLQRLFVCGWRQVDAICAKR